MKLGDLTRWAKAQPLMAAIALLLAIPACIVGFFILAAIAGIMAPVLIPAILVVLVSMIDYHICLHQSENFF